MAVDPNNLGGKVTTRSSSWADLCHRAWGSEWGQPDRNIYKFSGGNNKDSTDNGTTGIYGVPGNTLLLVDGLPYPDMRDGLVMSIGQVNGAADSGEGSYQELSAT
jgi:hypothetical protein